MQSKKEEGNNSVLIINAPTSSSDIITVQAGFSMEGTPKYIQISRKCIEHLGLDISTPNNSPISSGGNGSVYSGCPKNNASKCNSVVKIGSITWAEVFIQNEAAKKGLTLSLLKEPFWCETVSGEYKGVIVLSKADKTLKQILKEPAASLTQEDARKIARLVRRFAQSNFMHHDLKPDNIMCNELKNSNGKVIERMWYIIDFGYSWYGGSHYGNLEFKPPYNNPYGWDFASQSLKKPCQLYGSWSLVLPNMPSPDWDLAQLTYYIWVYYKSVHHQRFCQVLLDEALSTGKVKPSSSRVVDTSTNTYYEKWQVTMPDLTQVEFPASNVEEARALCYGRPEPVVNHQYFTNNNNNTALRDVEMQDV